MSDEETMAKAFEQSYGDFLDKLDHYDFGSEPWQQCHEYKLAVKEAFEEGWRMRYEYNGVSNEK